MSRYGFTGQDLATSIENSLLNTGVYNAQASRPTHTTKGLINPACNNAALTVLRNVVASGYQSGLGASKEVSRIGGESIHARRLGSPAAGDDVFKKDNPVIR
jgi:hypothetical protein